MLGYSHIKRIRSKPIRLVSLSLFRSMLHSTHCSVYLPVTSPLEFMPMKLHTSHSALVLPTAIITSTNIHLFYDVFLMEHINCLRCSLAAIHCYSFFAHFVFYFNNFFLSFCFTSLCYSYANNALETVAINIGVENWHNFRTFERL